MAIFKCTVKHGQLNLLVKTQIKLENPTLLTVVREQVAAETRDKIFCLLLKELTREDDEILQLAKDLIKGTTLRQEHLFLSSLDKSILQYKQGEVKLANRVLALFRSGFGGLRIKVVRLVAAYWGSPNLNRVASGS
jgi:hypothetical protein